MEDEGKREVEQRREEEGDGVALADAVDGVVDGAADVAVVK